jgi:hypothetical protein
MLTRALGVEATDAAAGFADVDPTAYYAGALAAAKASDLIRGVGDGRFAPEASIPRQDLCTMTHRALIQLGQLAEPAEGGSSQALDAFSDRAAVAAYAVSPMAALVEEQILTGDDGLLAPLRTASRAETAAILHRILTTRNEL